MARDGVSACSGKTDTREARTDAWRRSQKLGRRMEAHVRSDEGRNLRFCRSVDEEVVMVARVPRTRSGSQESEVARVSVPGADVGA